MSGVASTATACNTQIQCFLAVNGTVCAKERRRRVEVVGSIIGATNPSRSHEFAVGREIKEKVAVEAPVSALLDVYSSKCSKQANLRKYRKKR